MKFNLVSLELFLPAFLLSILGLFVVLSIKPDEFNSQLTFTILGILIFACLSIIDFTVLTALFPYLYLIQIVLLLITLLVGSNIRGSQRWINLGGLYLQTSEMMKPILVAGISYLGSQLNLKKYSHFLLSLVLVGVPALLIFIQPDLGSTIIVVSIGLFLVLALAPAKSFVFLSVLAVAITLPVLWSCLKPYQKMRVSTFLNPQADPLGASYNQIQAIIAAGSGGIFGKGLGKGTQSHLQFLPEKHTDFFFASLAEELGFVGSSIVILLFTILCAQLLILVSKCREQRLRLLFLGVFVMIFLQAGIHIGINLGLLPVTGITLPFLSVGGSSITASWFALGLASSAIKDVKPREAIFLSH
ncbi:MAG: FtsW/RodA/SpoVE family cell cycle protein [Patescibacteria group bacterium]|jgi:rod shape determining protein RodA